MIKKLSLLILCVCGAAYAEEIDHQQLSETLGHLLVRHLDQPGFACDFDKVIKGIKDARAGKNSPLTEEEYEQAVYTIQENIFVETAEKNLAEALTFLEKNSLDKDVKQVDPKLQYRVAQSGKGKSVGPESTPLIHYKGHLLDGTVFASSDEPLSLPIKQSIPGFSRGLVGMKEGEKRILYIHPELAYGISGNLPPNSLLIFEVEVVKAHAEPPHEIASK